MGEQRRRMQQQSAQDAQEQQDDHGRKVWIYAVLGFWTSAGVTLVVTFITGKLDLILVSITLGMMILGIALKIRYRLRQRKARAADTPRTNSS